MYTHYARLGTADDNGNPAVEAVFSEQSAQYTYDDQTDIILIASSTNRHPHPWHYTENKARFTKYAYDSDGTYKVVELEDIESYKATARGNIDQNTGALIVAGFTFDNKTFSLSPVAQQNFLTLKAAENDFIWPVEITTIDDTAYSLTQANMPAFVKAGIDAVKGLLDSGRALKVSINAASTKSAVDAIEDNR